MKRPLPPLNWLRTFEAAATQLSFTSAAEQLNMTSAAVSKQVKNLEYKLGVSLFKRLPNGLELSEHGAAYLPIVREAVMKLGTATDELFGQQRNKVLNLKVSLVFFLHWLSPRLHDFYARHPEVALRVNSNIWASDGMIEQGADLEIRYGKGAWAGLVSEPLTNDELFPVCSPSLIENEALLEMSDLKHHTLLHVIGYTDGWASWLSAFAEAPIKPKAEHHFDTLLAAFDLAERGQGVALARSSLVSEQLESGRLIAPFNHRLQTDEAFHLLHTQGELSSNGRVFRDWVLSVK